MVEDLNSEKRIIMKKSSNVILNRKMYYFHNKFIINEH